MSKSKYPSRLDVRDAVRWSVLLAAIDDYVARLVHERQFKMREVENQRYRRHRYRIARELQKQLAGPLQRPNPAKRTRERTR